MRFYSLAIREQLKDTNVRVIEALPPVVDTQMNDGNPMKKMSPEECARQIMNAVIGDRGRSEYRDDEDATFHGKHLAGSGQTDNAAILMISRPKLRGFWLLPLATLGLHVSACGYKLKRAQQWAKSGADPAEL